MKEVFNRESTIKESMAFEEEEEEEATERNMVPLMSIGTISNRSGSFVSPGMSVDPGAGGGDQNDNAKKKKGYEVPEKDFAESIANKLKNPPIRSPSKSGRDSKISVERYFFFEK